MRFCLKLAMIGIAACPAVVAQVAPSATTGIAELRYTLRYAQLAQFGGNLGDWQTFSPSGELAYSNGAHGHPLVLDYGGGYVGTEGGIGYSTGAFHHLEISQNFVLPKWNFLVSDDTSYHPQAPTMGFSGIAGIGDTTGTSGTTTSPGQSILTLSTHVLESTAIGNLHHVLNPLITLNLQASDDLLRYPGGNGLDTNAQTAGGGGSLRIDARESITANYLFYRFSYPDSGISFKANSVLLGIQRSWNRRLNTSASGGPVWIGSSVNNAVPTSVQFSAQAAVNYHSRSASMGLAYNRGASEGSGYLVGAETDTVSGNYSRQIGRKLTAGITGGYNHTSGLETQSVIESTFASAQVSRPIGRYLSTFASYSTLDQWSTSSLPTNLLAQVVQIASFGITYSRETNPKR